MSSLKVNEGPELGPWFSSSLSALLGAIVGFGVGGEVGKYFQLRPSTALPLSIISCALIAISINGLLRKATKRALKAIGTISIGVLAGLGGSLPLIIYCGLDPFSATLVSLLACLSMSILVAVLEFRGPKGESGWAWLLRFLLFAVVIGSYLCGESLKSQQRSQWPPWRSSNDTPLQRARTQ
jgi:hypothetical protein